MPDIETKKKTRKEGEKIKEKTTTTTTKTQKQYIMKTIWLPFLFSNRFQYKTHSELVLISKKNHNYFQKLVEIV